MEEEPVTFDELIGQEKLTSDIEIEISTPEDELLGDIILPAELVEENETTVSPVINEPTDAPSNDNQNETQKDAIEVVRDDEERPTFQGTTDSPKTVDGALSPKTASNMPLNILLGLVLFITGFWMLIKSKSRFAK